ncbi:MAG: hypothetical protein F6K41_06175 [Symploca sp. SIO3E6]|nr:hypothetical protein [Caldora sp. SIO3E6]
MKASPSTFSRGTGILPVQQLPTQARSLFHGCMEILDQKAEVLIVNQICARASTATPDAKRNGTHRKRQSFSVNGSFMKNVPLDSKPQKVNITAKRSRRVNSQFPIPNFPITSQRAGYQDQYLILTSDRVIAFFWTEVLLLLITSKP